jgi:hypothetical protein
MSEPNTFFVETSTKFVLRKFQFVSSCVNLCQVVSICVKLCQVVSSCVKLYDLSGHWYNLPGINARTILVTSIEYIEIS